jgi:hypothetical protein
VGKSLVLGCVAFFSFAARADTSAITCSVFSWQKSGEAQPEQKLIIDLKDGPYGSRFGSSNQALVGGDSISLSITQMALSGPRTAWRLEVQGGDSKPQVTSGEVGSDTRIKRLLLRSELDKKTVEVSCPL